MRLFVGVQPPGEVLDALAALARPDVDRVRWVGPEQWHVTLRFLGEVTDPEPVADALARAALPAAEAVVGPTATTLGRRSLVLPVAGLDALAAGVAAATASVGEPPGPFRGHLTLARARGRAKVPGGLAARVPAFEARFPVADVRLVRSHLGAGGPRYEDLAVVPLG